MIFDFFSDLFFPRACVACRSAIPAGVVCDGCFGTIATNRRLFPFEQEIDVPCLLGAAGIYKNKTLQALIHSLKFEGVREAAAPLADILFRYAKSVRPLVALDGYIVIPVPLSRRRERARGFNQSALIAELSAEKLALPFEKNLLVRIRHTKPQSGTENLHERKENLHDCFAVPDAERVRGKRILLIDDVTTSGTTFLEAARVLHAAGAKEIVAFAIARA